MPARTSESFVLRTYPFREADLIVSFFTRDQGKLRGVARRARRPKSAFGASLERLSHANIAYFQKETRELVSLNSAELIQSQFALASLYESSVALDFLAEVSEQILPAGEVNERHFRLLGAVLQFLRGGGSVWPAATYFSLWAIRLAGFLPDMRLEADSRAIAEEMLATPISQLATREWTRETATDLRQNLLRVLEEHLERRILSARMLEAL
jgi:DNA repair protein RecO (recombination protein O)